jgi:aspartate kinase
MLILKFGGTSVGSAKRMKAVAAKDGIIAINIVSDRMLMAYGFLRSHRLR